MPWVPGIRATLSGKFSYEDDFHSATVNASLERDFNEENTTVSAGVNSETDRSAAMMLEVEYGALATSGDSHRFLIKDGIRYGHVLDPRTGWPVSGSPRSVTVAASSCTEAGLLSTLAMLKGAHAQRFLDEQGVRYWLL